MYVEKGGGRGGILQGPKTLEQPPPPNCQIYLQVSISILHFKILTYS